MKGRKDEKGFLLVEIMSTLMLILLMVGGTVGILDYYKGNKLAVIMFEQMALIADSTDSYIHEKQIFPVNYTALRVVYPSLPLNTPFGNPYSISGDIHKVLVRGAMSSSGSMPDHTVGSGTIRLVDTNGTFEYKRTSLGYSDNVMNDISDPALGTWGAGAWPW